MPRIAYIEKNFQADTLEVIGQANAIIDDYLAQGYQLTLRQLYYRFVATDLIPNNMRSYKRLGSILNDARLAGHVDWEAIEDRTRNLEEVSHWATPAGIIRAAANSYRVDKWENQPIYVEVWIEKDALAGVFERVCTAEDVPWFSCRGYTSQSEMWSAAQRIANRAGDRDAVVLHFGDHDPSGIDMTRDIQDRLELFGATVDVERIALNYDQVEEYDPPPNPAKLTDSRAKGYIAKHGRSSWELDALEPTVLAALVREEVHALRDDDRWEVDVEREEEEREALAAAAKRWPSVQRFLEEE